jgi:hypothetical protein
VLVISWKGFKSFYYLLNYKIYFPRALSASNPN